MWIPENKDHQSSFWRMFIASSVREKVNIKLEGKKDRYFKKELSKNKNKSLET